MALPKITQSELLRRWQSANQLSWEVYAITCSDCGVEFKTGDVNFTFPAPPPPKPLPCETCGGSGYGEAVSNPATGEPEHEPCADCGGMGTRGEVPAIARTMPAHRCVACTGEALRKGIRFDGVAVFVEKQHQNRTVDQLPLELQGRLLESFALVDRLSEQLEAAARGQRFEPS